MTKEFLTEELVSEITDKFINEVGLKLRKILIDDSFQEIRDCIDQIYQNAIDAKEQEYIDKISCKFIEKPNSYKFRKLRDILFDENKEIIIKHLNDHAIEETVESIILKNVDVKNYFNWQWKDSIVNIILENFETIKDDDRIQTNFIKEIKNKDNEIRRLQSKVDDLYIVFNKIKNKLDPESKETMLDKFEETF